MAGVVFTVLMIHAVRKRYEQMLSRDLSLIDNAMFRPFQWRGIRFRPFGGLLSSLSRPSKGTS